MAISPSRWHISSAVSVSIARVIAVVYPGAIVGAAVGRHGWDRVIIWSIVVWGWCYRIGRVVGVGGIVAIRHIYRRTEAERNDKSAAGFGSVRHSKEHQE
jgi:hypothetical protein